MIKINYEAFPSLKEKENFFIISSFENGNPDEIVISVSGIDTGTVITANGTYKIRGGSARIPKERLPDGPTEISFAFEYGKAKASPFELCSDGIKCAFCDGGLTFVLAREIKELQKRLLFAQNEISELKNAYKPPSILNFK